MSDSKELMPMADKDYDAIEAAVMESARGRWFLAEYTQRNRHADTLTLLEAIHKLEQSVGGNIKQDNVEDPDKIKFDLMEMASAIAQTKNEIAALTPADEEDSRIMAATEELDAIITATETATGDILGAAESVQEIIWTMREAGTAEEQCDDLENLITQVYTACSFQDITGQRINKVVTLMKYLEERLDAMVNIWGGDNIASAAPPPPAIDARADAHLLNGPQLDGQGNDQEDIDLMFVDAGSSESDPVMPAEEVARNTENDTEINVPEADEEDDIAFEESAIVAQAQIQASSTLDAETISDPLTANAFAELDQDDKHALFT